MTPPESIELLARISGRPAQSLRTSKVQKFVQSELDCCPLAVSQIASILKDDDEQDVDAFIDRCAAQSKAVMATALKMTDLISSGETPEYRRAIMTTFNINLAYLRTKHAAYPRILEDAAFMLADSIVTRHLFELSRLRGAPSDEAQRKLFRAAVLTTSLMHFEPGGASDASMHRIVQLVLRFAVEQRGGEEVQSVLRAVLQFFAAAFQQDSQAMTQMTFLLRQIAAQASVFSALPPTDGAVLDGLLAISKQYLARREPARALPFLNQVLRHAQVSAVARAAAEPLVLNALRALDWRDVDSRWIARLLGSLSASGRLSAMQYIHERTKEAHRVLQDSWKAEDLSQLSDELLDMLALASTLLFSQVPSSTKQEASGAIYFAYRQVSKGIEFVESLLQEKEGLLSSIQATVDDNGGHMSSEQEDAIDGLTDKIADLHEQHTTLQTLQEEAQGVCETHAIQAA